MPAESLFAVPAQPRKLYIVLEHTPEERESSYGVSFTVENTKGSGGVGATLHWPEGANDLIGPLLGVVGDTFVWTQTAGAVQAAWVAQLARAKLLVAETRM